MKLLLLAMLPSALFAQTLDGTWQGTMAPPGMNEFRAVIKIAKAPNAFQGTVYNIDYNAQFNLGEITLQGKAVKIVFPSLGAIYQGKIDASGNAMEGSLSQGTAVVPMPLKRATPETAWEIPPPRPAPQPLPESTKLEFEVATIKPTPPDQQGRGINVNNGFFRARNNSLLELITFAFSVHRNQLSGLPAWAETEHYDIEAPLPPGGSPNDIQTRVMVQNLLKERFGYSFHTEKRELSAYVIRVGKAGPPGLKLVKNDSGGLLPGFGMQGLGRLRVNNARMVDFSNYLQLRVLDRPVIDDSGIAGRFDFMLEWTPDEFQFAGAPPAQRAAILTGPDAPPDLLTAFQEQLGMKIEAVKAPVDVLVTDKVSRPSEN